MVCASAPGHSSPVLKRSILLIVVAGLALALLSSWPALASDGDAAAASSRDTTQPPHAGS